MRFTIGSETDIALSIALKHEFLRCEDAFKEFEKIATAVILISQAQKQSELQVVVNESRLLAFKMYNAYARFVHHLYEFFIGAMARERRNTAQIRAEDADRWIQANAQRVLTGRRQSILNGTAPEWENHISAFPETVPLEFASEFRSVRNKINGHVTYERAHKSLTDFYAKYHKFIHMIYWNCLGFWGFHKDDIFPDLREITGFSVLVTMSTPPFTSTSQAEEEAETKRSEDIMNEIWRQR